MASYVYCGQDSPRCHVENDKEANRMDAGSCTSHWMGISKQQK